MGNGKGKPPPGLRILRMVWCQSSVCPGGGLIQEVSYQWSHSISRDSSREGVSNDAVPLVRGMNIRAQRRRSTHPGIGTDVGIWCRCTAEGAKDIDDGETKSFRIRGKNGVETQRQGDCSRADVLVRVIVVHQH